MGLFGSKEPNFKKLARNEDIEGLVKVVENSKNRETTVDAIHHLALIVSRGRRKEKREEALEALRKLMWHQNPEVKEIALEYMTVIVSPVIENLKIDK